MVQELLSELIEVRPGRTLHCCHWILGSNRSNVATINLVCIHGTAAAHTQYLPLLRAIDSQLETTTDKITIDCWLFDAVGCGKSPPLENSSEYADEQVVSDIQALLKNQVQHLDRPTFFIAHSYGPNWVYKTLKSSETPKMNLQGLIIVSSGVKNSKFQLQSGGPSLFKLPLWLLNCLQPLLSKEFLRIGFSKTTHKTKPEVIEHAKALNSANKMKTVCQYYKAHDWVETIDDTLRQCCETPLIVHGSEDQIVPIECGQALANQWHVPLISVDEASHMVLMEQPETLAEHICKYMMKK